MRWVLMRGERFVAVDNISGGYPYFVASPYGAELWVDKQAAMDYATVVSEFGPFTLHSVMYSVSPAHSIDSEAGGPT